MTGQRERRSLITAYTPCSKCNSKLGGDCSSGGCTPWKGNQGTKKPFERQHCNPRQLEKGLGEQVGSISDQPIHAPLRKTQHGGGPVHGPHKNLLLRFMCFPD